MKKFENYDLSARNTFGMKVRRKLFTLFILCGFLSLFVNCTKLLVEKDQNADKTSFLTGECLRSNEMTTHSTNEGASNIGDYYILSLSLDLDKTREVLDRNFLNWVYSYRFIPSKDVFGQFENKKKIKKEFENVYSELNSGPTKDWFDVTTIYYFGGMSISADKEWAGYKAGEDLTPLVSLHGSISDQDYYDYIIDGEFKDAIALPSGFQLKLDYEGYSLTKEKVKLSIQMPVKVVNYLTWLDDKLTDPDAPIPYFETVLTGNVTIQQAI
ncbi:MAG: hypothetical protein IJ222_04185 [Bacteroidales bacterium]|nr:hypothetical protein [Bacteroidales bacterium]